MLKRLLASQLEVTKRTRTILFDSIIIEYDGVSNGGFIIGRLRVDSDDNIVLDDNAPIFDEIYLLVNNTTGSTGNSVQYIGPFQLRHTEGIRAIAANIVLMNYRESNG